MSHPLISNFQSVGGLLLRNLILSTFGFLLFKLKVKILPQKLLQRSKKFSGGHLGLMTTNYHHFPLILSFVFSFALAVTDDLLQTCICFSR